MQVILIPLGSVGDVNPFLWLGRGLKSRGHRVTMIGNPVFETKARDAGFAFHGLGSVELYREAVESPEARIPKSSLKIIRSRVLPWLVKPLYEAVVKLHVPGETVVVANLGAFGARIAQDHLGIPLATVYLQPYFLRSIYETPRHPDVPIFSRLPKRWKRTIYTLVDLLGFDPMFRPQVNAFRTELGLPPIKRCLRRWLPSPQRIIGLFPDWFGRPQLDWPSQVRLTGFPLFDAGDEQPLAPEVAAFLDGGEPPIAFTMGSPFGDQAEFFRASVQACVQLGRRGILVTPHAEQVPASLPDGILHVDSVPYSRLFPRVSMVVHHGGVGTLSQALLAGVPQLIMPIVWDQPDNGLRLANLGVGLTIKRRLYTADVVAAAVRKLTGSKEVTARCQEMAEKLRNADPLKDTCEIVEQLQAAGTRH